MASTSRPAWNEVGEWTRMKKLGEGGFGSVYLAKRNSDGKLFVVKSVYFVPRATSKNPDEAENELKQEKYSLSNLINEIRTLRKLKSPYIVRYIGCGTSKGPPEMRGRLLLDCYLEYLPRGSLADLLLCTSNYSLEEPFIKAYTKDILRAIVYLHFNKIVHGDIKCANVLMDSKNCKLADFGSVKDVRTSFFSKILIGTSGYKAPEVLVQKEQTYASDIFSLGCTVVEMVVGESNSLELLKRHPPTFKPADIPAGLSAQCKDFLSRCIGLDPASRWSASDLLKHPFITEPSSPGWSPYYIPPERDAGLRLKKEGVFLIIPPENLDSSLPTAPFSPIPAVQSKRRKMDLSGCYLNQDETAVDLPAPPAWKLEDQTYTLGMVPALDRHSATPSQSVQDIKYPPFNAKPRGDTQTRRKPPGALAFEAAINRLEGEMKLQKSSVGSVTYHGHEVELKSPLANLEGDDEDTDPVVVKICDEFGIPLPLAYQKWILDPDFDPDAVANNASGDNVLRRIYKRFIRAAKAGLHLVGL